MKSLRRVSVNKPNLKKVSLCYQHCEMKTIFFFIHLAPNVGFKKYQHDITSNDINDQTMLLTSFIYLAPNVGLKNVKATKQKHKQPNFKTKQRKNKQTNNPTESSNIVFVNKIMSTIIQLNRQTPKANNEKKKKKSQRYKKQDCYGVPCSVCPWYELGSKNPTDSAWLGVREAQSHNYSSLMYHFTDNANDTKPVGTIERGGRD